MKIINSKVKTEDGFSLDVVKYCPTEPKKLLVMCHGLTGTKGGPAAHNTELIVLAKKLCECDYKVIAFDFRAHGQSEGKSTDVSVSSGIADLHAILADENSNLPLSFFGFSYGAMIVYEYVFRYKITADKVVLWSPSLSPVKGFVGNPNSTFGRDIVEANQNGSLHRDGSCVIKIKDFRVSAQFVDECYALGADRSIACLPNDTLVLQGAKDVILSVAENKLAAARHGFKYIELPAIHFPIEDIENAIALTVDAFK